MAKTILGWNDIPDGYFQVVDFYKAPTALRFLANLKIVEKYAYPIAARKGLISRWAITKDYSCPEVFYENTIKYINKDRSGEFEVGSESFDFIPSTRKINFRLQVCKARFMMIGILLKAILRGRLQSRWGAEKNDEFIKSKVEAARELI